METRLTQVAEKCLRGAENDTMTFPQIVARLMQEGFKVIPSTIGVPKRSTIAQTATASSGNTPARCAGRGDLQHSYHPSCDPRSATACAGLHLHGLLPRSWTRAARATSSRSAVVEPSISVGRRKPTLSTSHSRCEVKKPRLRHQRPAIQLLVARDRTDPIRDQRIMSTG